MRGATGSPQGHAYKTLRSQCPPKCTLQWQCSHLGSSYAPVVYFIQRKRDAEESRWEVGPKKQSLIRETENPRSSHLTNKAFQ